MRVPFAQVAEPVGDCKNEYDQGQRQREGQDPQQLRAVRNFLKVEIPRQRIDRGDADDRAEQLLLERAEIDMGQAFGPVGMRIGMDAADEILVAGENDDKDQIGRQRQVDQVEQAGDHVVPALALHLEYQRVEIDVEAVDQQKQAQQQAEQKRRQ